jgi:hypothetical protein
VAVQNGRLSTNEQVPGGVSIEQSTDPSEWIFSAHSALPEPWILLSTLPLPKFFPSPRLENESARFWKRIQCIQLPLKYERSGLAFGRRRWLTATVPDDLHRLVAGTTAV